LGRYRCSILPESLLHQSLGTRARSFPLPLQNAAQSASHPSVKFLQDALRLGQPEVSDPAVRDGREIRDDTSNVRPRPGPHSRLQLAPESHHVHGATRRRSEAEQTTDCAEAVLCRCARRRPSRAVDSRVTLTLGGEAREFSMVRRLPSGTCDSGKGCCGFSQGQSPSRVRITNIALNANV
jgi:hypothetical protein